VVQLESVERLAFTPSLPGALLNAAADHRIPVG
jgi:hypothetical protein